MPDLTTHTAYTCSTNEDWETTVMGSKGDVHVVRFERLYGREMQRQMCQHGYVCDCKGFQFRGTCKHIKQVEESGARCGWNAELDPSAEADRDASGNPICPECGAPVSAHRVAV